MSTAVEEEVYASYQDRILAYRKALWVTPLLTKEPVFFRERTIEDYL